LAAGFGTRLRPLTESTPKPLVKVAGVPMLTLALNRLRRLKPRILIVNGHHLSVHLEKYLRQSDSGFRQLEYVFESSILDTGGGIFNAARFLNGPFFVTLNADVATDIDLLPAVVSHLRRDSLVTMILHDNSRYNQVEVDLQNCICGFGRERARPGNRLWAYTGIQICSPRIFALMARERERSFSLIAFYRRLLGAGRRDLGAHIVDTEKKYYWRDLGTHDELAALEKDLSGDLTLADRLGFGLPENIPGCMNL